MDPPKPPPQPKQPPKWNFWYLLAIIAFLIAIIGVIVLLTVWIVYRKPVQSYGIVVDAGSTSSKVYLYTWPDYPNRWNGHVREVTNCKTELGISSYQDNPSKAADQIMECINGTLMPRLPREKWPRTMLNLGATAGMRILSYSDFNATKDIYEVLRTRLSQYPFIVDDPVESIRTITGSEEATMAWVSVNYLMNILGKPKENTFGGLDLGGASTQITFVPGPNAILPKDHRKAEMYITNLTLFNENYPVYGHSFLCYGKSMAQKRLLALVAQQANFSLNIDNPCMPSGATEEKKAADVFTVPCVQGQFARTQYGYEIVPPKRIDMASTIFTFKGTSEPDKCRTVTGAMFNNTKTCSYNRCSFNGAYQPPVGGKFLAFAGFYYTMDFFNLTKTDVRSQADYQGMVKAINRYCEMNWEQVSEIPSKENYLRWSCFDGVYMQNLLNGYGFNETNFNTIEFVEKVHESKVGWSLGYMIDETGHLEPPKSMIPPISLTAFILLLLLFVAFIFLGGALLVTACKRKTRRGPSAQDGYGSI